MGTPCDKKEGREKVSFLTLAGCDDFRIVGRSLDPHVPGVVVVGTVLIVFAVGFVVLLVVADQVFQREAIVCSDEIDAGVGTAAIILIQIAAAGKAVTEIRKLSFVALPIAANGIAIFTVPLRP